MTGANKNTTKLPDMGLRRLIAADLFRIDRRTGVKELLRQLAVNRAYRAVFTYRLCKWLRTNSSFWAKLFFPMAYLAHRFLTGALCSEIPIGADIGSGFLLLHGYGVVINRGAVIGKNATVFHQVTLGATSRGVPNIGNQVVLGAQAMVLGPVSVGDEATIGAGSVVLKDVVANSIVAGNPAQTIADGVPSRAKNVLL